MDSIPKLNKLNNLLIISKKSVLHLIFSATRTPTRPMSVGYFLYFERNLLENPCCTIVVKLIFYTLVYMFLIFVIENILFLHYNKIYDYTKTTKD